MIISDSLVQRVLVVLETTAHWEVQGVPLEESWNGCPADDTVPSFTDLVQELRQAHTRAAAQHQPLPTES